MADKWFVYKRTTSNVCTVQTETSAPHLGVQHLGPFNSKVAATKAMCADVDETMTDPTHCWVVSPEGACSKAVKTGRIGAKKKQAKRGGKPANARLTLAQVKTLVEHNNNSPFADELVIAICWAESSFDPTATANNSTAAGLMMMTHGAIDTVNRNTPEGVHFDYDEMSDGARAVACGTWYLRVIYEHDGGQSKRVTLKLYRGAQDYVYADKVIACESCLQSAVVPDPQTCLNQIHTLSET